MNASESYLTASPGMDAQVPHGIDVDVGSLLVVDTRQDVAYADSDNFHPAVEALMHAIFSLPIKASDDGLVVSLPEPAFRLPREKQIPRERALTKWEQFAKEKGIQKKKKRDRLVWDEAKQEFVPRFGKGSARALDRDAILPHNDNLSPGDDPFAAAKRDKKKRTKENKKRQLANMQRSGNRTKHKVQPLQALDVAPSGPSGKKKLPKSKLRDSISVAQRSTASMGRFDGKLKNEPRVKLVGQRQKLPDSTPARASLQNEKERSQKVLERILKDS